MITRALGILLGVAADAALGDPARHHPVAWFGAFAGRVEEKLYADDSARGAAFTAATLAPILAGGIAVECVTRRHPVAHIAATAIATWVVLGARSLADEGRTMAERLDDDDLDDARGQLGNLCGRDPEGLDEPELARATVESLAENTADAAVASLLWGSALGIPGMLVHRAANTLDAMVGHRNDRYARFGTASARLDDALDWLPARVTGLLACLAAPVVGGSTREAYRVLRRDARNHPSPNGGWCESAWAGSLGVQLGGRNVYFSRVEERGLLGDGPRPRAAEVRKAARLVTTVTAAATGLAALAAAMRRTR